jgi:hypothetical protein
MRFILLAAALILPGCAATYENRIESKLVDAGLSRSVAACMAERLVDRLSATQLQSLGRLAGSNVGEMRVDAFLQRARATVDPEVFAVVTRVGVGCALAG